MQSSCAINQRRSLPVDSRANAWRPSANLATEAQRCAYVESETAQAIVAIILGLDEPNDRSQRRYSPWVLCPRSSFRK